MGEKIVNIRVRFPEPLRDRVKAFAERDRRSLNSEILALLEEAMEAREEKSERPSSYQYGHAGEHATAHIAADHHGEYRSDPAR